MRGRLARVAFADQKVLDAFNALEKGRFEDRELAGWIRRAMGVLEEKPFAGASVPKRLWPREYARFSINNLRKLNMPRGWRLVYFIKGNELEIVSVLLEWADHKSYEKRFGYRSH